MIPLVVQHHLHRALTHLRRKFVRRFAHAGSTFSEVGASDKPGALQFRGYDSGGEAVEQSRFREQIRRSSQANQA
jgi:hypothetical protein